MKNINKSCFVAIAYVFIIDFWIAMFFIKPAISFSGLIGTLFFIFCFFPVQRKFVNKRVRNSLIIGMVATFISNMAFNVSLCPAIICSIIMMLPIFFIVWEMFVNDTN